jgi:hypothetical protein
MGTSFEASPPLDFVDGRTDKPNQKESGHNREEPSGRSNLVVQCNQDSECGREENHQKETLEPSPPNSHLLEALTQGNNYPYNSPHRASINEPEELPTVGVHGAVQSEQSAKCHPGDDD